MSEARCPFCGGTGFGHSCTWTAGTAAVVEWNYTVKPDKGSYQARQYMNGQLLKIAWAETEDDAHELCKSWALKSVRHG
jgi:hypothetical protein